MTANPRAKGPGDHTDAEIAAGIREQVDRVVTSSDFAGPDRLKAFLRYVVEETLAGREERIKAYSVAVEVFGREETFDPQNDPVVRVEAGRLRRSLERYYLTSGRFDPIHIEIPKGRYVPIFTFVATAPSPPPTPVADDDVGGADAHRLTGTTSSRSLPRVIAAIAAALLVTVAAGVLVGSALSSGASKPEALAPTILVAPLKAVGGGRAADYALSLSEEIGHQLALFREVVPLHPVQTGGSGEVRPDYTIDGSVRGDDVNLRVTASLVEAGTGAVLWTQSFETHESARGDNLIRTQVEMASAIAGAVAQPYGAIFQAEAREIGSLDAATPSSLTGRPCLVAFYMYRVSLSAADHLKVRDCIDRVVDGYPRSSTARAMRSLLAVDEDRFAYNHQPNRPPALERALADAHEAVRLEPRNMRALQALMLALSFSGEPEEALAVAADAYAHNPNDAEFISEYGTRIAHYGDWKKGGEIIATAMRMNPAGTPYYTGVLAFSAYMERDITRALYLVRQSRLEPSPIFQLVSALIYTDAGLPEEAARARELSMASAPSLFENLRREAAKRNFRAEDLEFFLDGARRAGFPVATDHAGTAASGPAGALVPPPDLR